MEGLIMSKGQYLKAKCTFKRINDNSKNNFLFIFPGTSGKKYNVLALDVKKLGDPTYISKLRAALNDNRIDFEPNNLNIEDRIEGKNITTTENGVTAKKGFYLDHDVHEEFRGIGKLSPEELLAGDDNKKAKKAKEKAQKKEAAKSTKSEKKSEAEKEKTEAKMKKANEKAEAKIEKQRQKEISEEKSKLSKQVEPVIKQLLRACIRTNNHVKEYNDTLGKVEELFGQNGDAFNALKDKLPGFTYDKISIAGSMPNTEGLKLTSKDIDSFADAIYTQNHPSEQ